MKNPFKKFRVEMADYKMTGDVINIQTKPGQRITLQGL